jgi:hypothetical protein
MASGDRLTGNGEVPKREHEVTVNTAEDNDPAHPLKIAEAMAG